MTRKRFLLSVALLGVVFVALGAAQRYPGVTSALWYQWRYASLAESRNLMGVCLYWLGFMQELSFDESIQGYRFPETGTTSDAFAAALLDYHRGEYGEAVERLERLTGAGAVSEERLFWLGMSYLRQAENDNCLTHLRHHGHEPGMCSLPLDRHHQGGAMLRAAKVFERLVARKPEDRLYLWLAYFTSIAAGTEPDALPKDLQIESAFIEHFNHRDDGESNGLRFRDRARELGVDTLDTGRGVVVEDFDRDGDLDIVTGGSFDTVRFYDNQEGLSFLDKTAEVGLSGVTQPFVMTAADYDNDGWIDLFVGRPFDVFRLFRNDGTGHFLDVTADSGLLASRESGEVAATWVSAWGDIDLDGDLDLFLAQWALRLPFVQGLMARPRMDSQLFRNDDGKFSDVTDAWGLGKVVRDEYFIGATFGDFNGDRLPELFLSSPLRATSALLRNTGDRFVRMDTGRTEGGFVAAFVDVDHDGRLDIFQSGFADARTSVEQAVFGENLNRYRSGNSTILRTDSTGRWQDRSDFFGGGTMPMGTMGASYGDLDNDGCFDFYLGTGTPESWFILPNLMYLGRRDGKRCTGEMDNISHRESFGNVQKGHGIVFFDFDNDGDQDIYSALGGMWEGDRWPNQLFVNESPLERTWIKVRLRGRQTNSFGVGARIHIEAVDTSGDRIVRRYHMDNKTGFGSAPYLAHIGLLDALEIVQAEVEWPVSGCRQGYSATLGALNIFDEADCFSLGGEE